MKSIYMVISYMPDFSSMTAIGSILGIHEVYSTEAAARERVEVLERQTADDDIPLHFTVFWRLVHGDDY